jgi:hypothetical protein
LLGLSLRWAEGKGMEVLDKPDYANPFFENVFEEKSASLSMPMSTRNLDWGVDRAAILKFKDGRPFLSKQGIYFLMSCPLDKRATDFYNHALFVPVMYRIAASSRRSEQHPYFSLTNQLISLRADSLFGEEPLKLAGPAEIVPAQRRVGDHVFLELPKFSMARGFYAVLYGKDTLNLLAFDLDKRESELAQYSADEITSLFGGGGRVSLFKADSRETFSSEIKARYLGTPLWKEAVLLALAFLLAEVLLVRFMK